MLKRYITLSFAILFSTYSYAQADNCDFRNISFGIGQEKIKAIYKIDIPEVESKGDAIIPIGSPDVCKDLPEQSVTEFLLLDNQLVQLQILNKNSEGELLSYATKIFGDAENKPKDPKKAQSKKLGLWSSEGHYNAIYTTYEKDGKEFEKLTITSTGNKDLFNEVNDAKSKAADDYLKENKLGAYSTENKEATKKTETIERAIPKDHKKTKYILKENEHSRGSHYEEEK